MYALVTNDPGIEPDILSDDRTDASRAAERGLAEVEVRDRPLLRRVSEREAHDEIRVARVGIVAAAAAAAVWRRSWNGGPKRLRGRRREL